MGEKQKGLGGDKRPSHAERSDQKPYMGRVSGREGREQTGGGVEKSVEQI